MLQRSISPFPILSALDISQHPPFESESTPPIPLAYNFITPRSCLKSFLEDTFGRFTIAPALNPVPKLDGHVKMYPKWLLCMN